MAWKPCRGWRGASTPLGGAREPQFSPHGAVTISLSMLLNYGRRTAFSPLYLSFKKEASSFPWNSVWKVRYQCYSLLSASSRVNRKTRAEHKSIKPWYLPLSENLFGVLVGLSPWWQYPWLSHSSTTTGNSRDANAASPAPTWHISHQFLHGSSELWAFPIALEWTNLKVCHPGHSTPIPTITITEEQTSSLVYPWWITATWQPPAQKDPTRSAHQGIYKSASLTASISSNSPRKGSMKMHCTHFRCCTWIVDSPALPFQGGRRKELPWFCEGRGTTIPNRAYQGMHVVHPISPWNKKSVAMLSSSLLQICLRAVTVLDVS